MTTNRTSKPRAVLISDIHFNVNNLELASTAFTAAMEGARGLEVPLIVAGDLLDTKAIIRAECANRIIQILKNKGDVRVEFIVGNHDLINEKSSDHSLKFLGSYAHVISSPIYSSRVEAYLLPYYNDSEKLRDDLASKVHKGATIIMHQGVQSAYMGDYVIDKTSLPKEVFADYRIISGHFHRHQHIKCGRPRKGAVGLFSYIGSPFTHTFGEANDGPKGYCILREDGILEQVPLNLRKHVIIECTTKELELHEPGKVNPDDLLWLKVKGPSLELKKLKKDQIGERLIGHSNFKLDLIPTDTPKLDPEDKPKTNEELMDKLIETSAELPASKDLLKKLWREIS